MGVYIAPEIKDRVAVGDDLYTITDSGGKKKLTPSPTEVSEPGTEINKALLQPMADALERIDAGFVPYALYWWRRRAVANGYSETRQTAVGETGVSHYSSTYGKTYYYLNAIRNYRSSSDSEWYTYYSTLTYASSISINQSTGAISLVNPSSYTFTASDNVSNSSVYTRFQGKFVKGFLGVESKVFFIPSSAYMETNSWTFAQGEEADEQGYEFSSDTDESHMPILINSTKVTSTGAWETISADASDAYPHSGESGGYEWAFLGRISDATVLLPDTARAQWKKITLTSANFSNNIANVAIKAKSALITVNCASGGGSAFGVLDVVNYVFHGIYINDQQYSQDRMAAVGTVSGQGGYILLDYYGSTNGTRLYMVAGGLKITAVDSSDHYVEINWLPLDSLEVGR